MPRIVFTANLQRHAVCPPCEVEGATVREALEAAFGLYPKVRGYVLDEHEALAAGHASEPGVLWAGTLPGGLFKSEDHGATWSLVRSLWGDPRRQKWSGGGADYAGIHSICVDPRDARRVSIAVSCGGVWHSDDGGGTWEVHKGGMRAEYTPPEQAYDPLGQDPHCMVQSPTHPEVVWVQHHNGIFRSGDGGWNWIELKDVPPSVFGFPVAVHPQDPDTAWFVPAVKDEKRFAVTRTRDGGRTFEVLREGLSPRMAGIPGPRSRSICRQCMPCGGWDSRQD